ncbi:MAG: thioesterase family protein [Clostridia bacterium]|nr:thioesterase family protein [Clostridia bacterium]
MLETGIKGTVSKTVTEDITAAAVGSGRLNVLATPVMIALIEEAAWKSVAGELEVGIDTVGTKINVEHLAPTPVGGAVRCETTLTEIDGRRLVFSAEVFDKVGLIGKGTHERFIVNGTKFRSKADERR